MLVADCMDGRVQRVEADKAERRDDYTCPECREPVILHKGKTVTPHFSHKPNAACAFGVGEGKDHMQIKMRLAQVFRSHGMKVAVEYPVQDRARSAKRYIADLFVWEGKNSFAVEVVDSHDDLKHIEEKEAFYKAMNTLCVWIPIVRKSKRDQFKKWAKVRKNPVRYRPTGFEKWLLDWRKRVHFVVPPNQFISCTARDFYIHIPRSDYGGGYSYASKAFRNLLPVNNGKLDELLDLKVATIERRHDLQSVIDGENDE
jgi:competence protein CoiA